MKFSYVIKKNKKKALDAESSVDKKKIDTSKMMQIEAVGSDGGVSFRDGSKILADIILHFTG